MFSHHHEAAPTDSLPERLLLDPAVGHLVLLAAEDLDRERAELSARERPDRLVLAALLGSLDLASARLAYTAS